MAAEFSIPDFDDDTMKGMTENSLRGSGLNLSVASGHLNTSGE